MPVPTVAHPAGVGVGDRGARPLRPLRDHGPSGAPRWSEVDGALGAPCVHAGGSVTAAQSTGSWVSDLRADPLHWITATSAPCTSTFHPARVDRPVDSSAVFGPDPTNRFDAASRWWTHELLHRLALRDLPAAIGRFEASRDRLESAWLRDPPDTATAFEQSAVAERAWLDDLRAADLGERRERWLVDLWQRFDDDAGVDAAWSSPAQRSS